MTPDQALGQLRHLYQQMVDGCVLDQKSAANGLLGPAIAALEAAAHDLLIANADADYQYHLLDDENEKLQEEIERLKEIEFRMKGLEK